MAKKERDQAVTILNQNISSAAQSANFTSNSYNIQEFARYALQLNITSQASLNLAVKVQATVDGTNWADVPATSQTFTANGTFIWDQGQGTGVIAIRLSFTFSAGSALFQVYAFSKNQ